jgi:hypothetical protein
MCSVALHMQSMVALFLWLDRMMMVMVRTTQSQTREDICLLKGSNVQQAVTCLNGLA